MSINTILMAITFRRVDIHSEKWSSIKSPNLLIKLFCKGIKNILAAVSLLPQGLWPLNVAKRWLTIRNLNPLNHTTLWTRGHVRSRDKSKIFYVHYHNTYGHQTWQGGCIQWGASIHKVTKTIWSRGLVILISLIRFVGLEHKRLSRHQLLDYNVALTINVKWRKKFLKTYELLKSVKKFKL